MFFQSRIMKKTVKELRKNQGYTAKELAEKLKLNTSTILKVDDFPLKDVPEPLKSKLLPILRGDYTDKIPWL
ncbi:MAG TPA: helix-turn-helix transcriptional regulator [Syntrophomonadaceae bacterium]|jgi:transcriptional regulator with XRE-family HTH domain|nr:helix-turn-helix transcriptional regulator [Syntrophomonadaceae bacterium]HOQ10235.1 helix-turn-helix transcriptional regulator [Syntrophomonadaceae bacterium]HPU49297.1 helix-turn-helix transcriptional regulator [Syntrophomonadaceae bacterium]